MRTLLSRRPAPGASASPLASERGFLLVGVVLFVVVLTILGLSLFGLSGFESQFLYASSRRADSFYAAAAGIERARFVVIADRPMSEAQLNLPAGVVYTVAKQGASFATADSSSAIDWSLTGDPATVWIRATANVQGEVTTLQQSFTPGLGGLIYERLFTLYGPEGLVVRHYDIPPQGHPGDRWAVTQVGGLVRATVPVRDEQGNFIPDQAPPNGFVRAGFLEDIGPGVEAPDLDTYFAQHWEDAEASPPMTGGNISFTGGYAGGPPGSPRFFKWPATGGSWSLDVGTAAPEIEVEGSVVWMFDKGLQYQGWLQVRGSNNPLLVIVARPCDSTAVHPYRTGVSFDAGVDQEEDPTTGRCPMILVSDARVAIMHDEPVSFDKRGEVTYLSVFARNAVLEGPVDDPVANPAHKWMRLFHPANAPQNDPGGVVYEAARQGMLPNTNGGMYRLDAIAGTWTEIPN